MKRTPSFVLAMFLLSQIAYCGQSSSIGSASSAIAPAVPRLSKDVKRLLDKNAQNAYKQCSADPDKDRPLVAGTCLDLAVALRVQAQDNTSAGVVLQRSCSLGNAGGCNELGKALAAGGDQLGAMKLWFGPVCGNQVFCRVSIFDSLANQKNVNLPQVEEIGLPLCDEGGDDRICRRLAELGSNADFANIARRHRAAKLQQLRNAVESAQRRAVIYDNAAAQMDSSANQTGTNAATALGSVFAAGAASQDRQKADSARSTAARLQTELANLSSEPIEYPTRNKTYVQQAGSSATCSASLEYLADVIPPFPGTPELTHIRDVGLSSSTAEVLQKVKDAGMTVTHGIELANRQADAAHANLTQIESCIRSATTPSNGNKIMQMLQMRSYQGLKHHDDVSKKDLDVLGACIESYVANDWQEVINREVAKQMALCH